MAAAVAHQRSDVAGFQSRQSDQAVADSTAAFHLTVTGPYLALEERLIKFILPDLQHIAATTLAHYAQRAECFREETREHDPPGCPRPGLALSR